METQKYQRKPFEVNAVQVTFENVYELAKWCGGTEDMTTERVMRAEMKVPCVVLPDGQKAPIASWIVERRGSFRVHNSIQFSTMFELVESK